MWMLEGAARVGETTAIRVEYGHGRTARKFRGNHSKGGDAQADADARLNTRATPSCRYTHQHPRADVVGPSSTCICAACG